MSSVTIGGTTIHYEVEGPRAAPALLLLNSLGASLGMWDDQLASWLKRFRVIRYDVRGHGQSSPVKASDAIGCSIATLAEDALAVISHAGIPAAHWCGLSLGGMTAMWAAAHRPDRVTRLVLCNTTAYLPPPSFWQARIDLVRREGMRAVAGAVTERWFSPVFRLSSPDKVGRIRAMLEQTDAESYAAACAAIRDMDQRPDLGRIAAPTLIVGGSLDPATPLSHSEGLHAGVTGSQIMVLPAAHLSNVECAPEFSAKVKEFLGAS